MDNLLKKAEELLEDINFRTIGIYISAPTEFARDLYFSERNVQALWELIDVLKSES